MVKKIKITEAQAKSLGLINENVDMLTQFEQFCRIKVQEVNGLYNKISAISVYELIHKQVNLSDYSNRLSRLDNELRTANRKVENSIIGHPDEDTLDSRLDKANYPVSDKISSLELIISSLESLESLSEEHKLVQSFRDVQPIDITSSQS